MDAVGVETFHDDLRLFREALNGSTVNDYVGRCDRFALVEAPDVQLMDRFNTRNLISSAHTTINRGEGY